MASVDESLDDDNKMVMDELHPLSECYLESINEPLKSFTRHLLEGEDDPAARIDQFEIQLRRALFDRIPPLLSAADPVEHSSAVTELGHIWVSILKVYLHLAHFTAAPPLPETVSTNNEDTQDSVPRYPDLLRKQIPIVLLEDIIEVLSTDSCVMLWEGYVVPSYDIIFSETLWSAKHHACWLAFVKVTVKLLRKHLPTQHAARLMQTVARVYPLSEKSGVKVWGSINTDNTVELESASFFEMQQSDLVTNMDKRENNAKEGTVADYSFYETFWKIQQDFHNPNGIAVADFLRRLQTFFAALESHKPDILTDNGMASRNSHKYLTSSRLLATQLRDADFQIHFLTQFLITAHHLTSQVETLAPRLAEFILKAKRLLKTTGVDGVYHLKIVDSILETLEPQWRRWKQNKCKPDLDTPRQSVHTGLKRKRKENAMIENDEQENGQGDCHYSVLQVKNDLPDLSRRMRSIVPSLDRHLEDYVEALDPESGIEAEYHPKNESLFSWRALRLLSVQHAGRQFEKISPNGDFEVVVRVIYKLEKDLDIPGEAPVYEEVNLDESYDSEKGNDEKSDVDEADEMVNGNGDLQDEQMLPKDDVGEDIEVANGIHKENDIDDDDADHTRSEAGYEMKELGDEIPKDTIDDAELVGMDERSLDKDTSTDINRLPDIESTDAIASGSKEPEDEIVIPLSEGEAQLSQVAEKTNETIPEASSQRQVSGEHRRSPPRDLAGRDDREHRRSPPRVLTGPDDREHRRSPPKSLAGPTDREQKRSPLKALTGSDDRELPRSPPRGGSHDRERRRSPPRGPAGSDDRGDRRFDGGRREDVPQRVSRQVERTDGPSLQGSRDARRGPADAPRETMRGRGNPPPQRSGARDHDRGGRDSDRRGGDRDHDRPQSRDNERGRGGPLPGRGDDRGRIAPLPDRERRGDGDWKGDRRKGGRRH